MESVKLNKVVRRYTTTRKKSGIIGLSLIKDTLEHAFEHGDWTPLAWLMGKMEEKEARIVRRIVGACTTGIKAEKDMKQPSGIVLHGFKKNEEGVRRAALSNNFGLLVELVADKHSFMSKTVQDMLFPSDRGEKEWGLADAIASYKRLIDKMEAHDLFLSDVLKAVAAEGNIKG